MDQTVYKGTISFINYEKQFATIDYLHNNKVKSVNCKTTETGKGQKPHSCKLGDVVSFQLKLADRGDKLTACNVTFRHNPAIDLLIQKAGIENRFSGYLKKVGDQYFVKEWEHYILFPLIVSPWELPPVETAENKPINFKLIRLDKPGSIAAELFSHNYIPAYRKAVLHFQNKMTLEARVGRISPHAVYLNLFSNQLEARLPLKKGVAYKLKEGDTVEVEIVHLTNNRIVVQKTGA